MNTHNTIYRQGNVFDKRVYHNVTTGNNSNRTRPTVHEADVLFEILKYYVPDDGKEKKNRKPFKGI